MNQAHMSSQPKHKYSKIKIKPLLAYTETIVTHNELAPNPNISKIEQI